MSAAVARAAVVSGVALSAVFGVAGVAGADTEGHDPPSAACGNAPLAQLSCGGPLVNVGPLVGGPILETGPIGPFTVTFPNGLFGSPR